MHALLARSIIQWRGVSRLPFTNVLHVELVGHSEKHINVFCLGTKLAVARYVNETREHET
jgi:hypothetical protein